MKVKWLVLAVLGALLAEVVLFSTLAQHYFSPFIQMPQGLVHPLSDWARPGSGCFDAQDIRNFAIIDLFFALTLLLLNLLWLKSIELLYHMSPAQLWSAGFGDWRRAKYLMGGFRVFVLTLIALSFFTDEWENIQLLQGNLDLSGLQNLKIICYTLTWTTLAILSVKLFLDRYYSGVQQDLQYLWSKLNYFYPSLIYIVALSVIFSNFDQFDALLVELTEGGPYLLFTVVMLMSIVLVWFIPDYLFFTDVLLNKYFHSIYEEHDPHPELAKKIIHVSTIFLPINWVLGKGRYEVIKKNYRKRHPEDGSDREQPFHQVRRWLALLFILTLVSLLLNSANDSFLLWPPGPILAVLVLALYFWRRALGHSFRLKNGHTSGQDRAIFLLLFGPILVYGLFNLGVLLADVSQQVEQWAVRHIFFTLAAVASAFVFLSFSFYRRKIRWSKVKSMRIHRFWKWLSRGEHILTFLLISSGVTLPLLMFVVVFGFGLYDINSWSWVNPINLFLIMVNGIIAFLAVADRSLAILLKWDAVRYKTRMQKGGEEKAARRVTRARFLERRRHLGHIFTATGICLFLLWFGSLSNDNRYHDVPYVRTQPAGDSIPFQEMDLERYTERFLERLDGPDSTIVIISSEGGGLRAAYWNMLVFQHLDSLTGGRFFDRVFLMSGASGGGIGQGMYTFMKSRGLSQQALSRKVDEIGRENFLSADLTGMFGKSLVAGLWRTGDLSHLQDRAEAMAEHYFELVEPGSYASTRMEPFAQPWQSNHYALPLLVINTTRTEDGRRGIVHPLKPDMEVCQGLIDLTSNREGAYIPYPDAVFLTNRFPLASPAASIEGRGHYVDGGYLENSGLQTVMHFLSQMRAREHASEVYQAFFRHRIILLSIGNSHSTFVDSQFKEMESLTNRNLPISEIQNILSAATSAGLSSMPIYYHRLFDQPEIQQYLGVSEFQQLALPFQLENADVHPILQGQVASCAIDERVRDINADIATAFPEARNFKTLGTAREGYLPVPRPPLGRIIAEPTIQYMKGMLDYGELKAAMLDLEKELR